MRGADRHPRRRGPSGRHGFQGRGDRDRHHRDPDGQQGRRHHPGRDASRAASGARRAAVHPGRDGKGDRRAAQGSFALCAAHRHPPDQARQDSRRYRTRRQGDPRAGRRDRMQDRHRGRRHRVDRFGRRRRDGKSDHAIQANHRRARDRQDLQRHGAQDRGLRRIRGNFARHRRPAAHLANLRQARAARRGRASRRRRSHGQGAGRRSQRQDPALSARGAAGTRSRREANPGDGAAKACCPTACAF